MPGDFPRSASSLQDEINRQALVDFGKRLAELEHRILKLSDDVEDLHYFSARALETAKRVQRIVRSLMDRESRNNQNHKGNQENGD